MIPYLPLRIIIPILLVFSALAASLGGYFYMREQNIAEIEKESIFDARQTLNLLQASVNVMLRRADIEGIRIQLSSLATNKDNIFTVLVDAEGKVMLSSVKKEEGRKIGELDPFFLSHSMLGEHSGAVLLSALLPVDKK